MSTVARPRLRALPRIAWVVLVFCFGAFTFSHYTGVYYGNSTDERHLFEIFGWLNLVGIAILVVPYRRQELWAWWATWAGIVPVGLVPAFIGFDPIGLTYLLTAVVLGVAQLVNLPGFLHGRSD
jgi:hypothetical protein